jgi:hypothetical protein
VIHVKVDVNMHDHPRFAQAGFAATGLWICGLAYSRKHELDGRVPKSAVWSFAASMGTPVSTVRALAARLVEVGLWREDGEAFTLLRYREKGNQTRAEIEVSRAQNREKQATWRERNRLVTNSYSSSDLDLGEGGAGGESAVNGHVASSETPEPTPPTPEPEPATREQDYQAAYERGIERGKGSPFALIERHRGPLHQGILKHGRSSTTGKALRGPALLAWIEQQAEDFARLLASMPPDEAKYWSAYQPTGWLRWLNEVPVAAPQKAPVPLQAVVPRPGPKDAPGANVAPANAPPDSDLRPVSREQILRLVAGIGRGGG